MPDIEEAAKEAGIDMQVEGAAPASAPEVQLVSAEAFHANIEFALAALGGLTGLKSLPIAEHEEDQARKATKGLYELAQKSSWFRWMVTEKTENVAALSAIAMFALPKMFAVSAELSERRSARVASYPEV